MGNHQAGEDLDQLVRIAWWYYIDGLTQDCIATKLRLSRPSVGRLLDRARALGITEIRLSTKYMRMYEAAHIIKDKFGLADVCIVPSPSEADLEGAVDLRRLGKAAAAVVEENSEGVETLAIGWGEAVASTVANMQSHEPTYRNIYSLTGGVNTYAFAMTGAGGEHNLSHFTHLLPAPLYVQSEELASALMQEVSLARHLECASHAGLAVIGVGGNTSAASLVTRGKLSESEIKLIRKAGAAGDILGVFFDQNGKPIELDLHRRRCGTSIEDLRRIPKVIGVAGGMAKLPSILGALRGGYLDILVTDMSVASALEKEISK